MGSNQRKVRFNGKTFDVRSERRIRGELYLIIGKYGTGKRPRERALHVLGGNEYQDKVIHRVDHSVTNWKNLNRAQGSNLPFARISSVTRDKGSILVIQEHIVGKSLRWHLSGDKSMSQFQAIRLYSQLVNQLCNLFRTTGIIHSDISPENLIVSVKGTRLVLIDFGSSFVFSNTKSNDGGDGFNPIYQAPEILMGNPADRLSEQLSAATIFYEMLTERLPFTAAEKSDFSKNRISLKLPSECRINSNPELPSSIWRAIDEHLEIALSLQRKKRFQTIKQWQASARKLKAMADAPNQATPLRRIKTAGFLQKWFG